MDDSDSQTWWPFSGSRWRLGSSSSDPSVDPWQWTFGEPMQEDTIEETQPFIDTEDHDIPMAQSSPIVVQDSPGRQNGVSQANVTEEQMNGRMQAVFDVISAWLLSDTEKKIPHEKLTDEVHNALEDLQTKTLCQLTGANKTTNRIVESIEQRFRMLRDAKEVLEQALPDRFELPEPEQVPDGTDDNEEELDTFLASALADIMDPPMAQVATIESSSSTDCEMMGQPKRRRLSCKTTTTSMS